MITAMQSVSMPIRRCAAFHEVDHLGMFIDGSCMHHGPFVLNSRAGAAEQPINNEHDIRTIHTGKEEQP